MQAGTGSPSTKCQAFGPARAFVVSLFAVNWDPTMQSGCRKTLGHLPRGVAVLALVALSLASASAQTPNPSGFVSDDFNTCLGGWTFSDPLGGSSRRVVKSGTGDAW